MHDMKHTPFHRYSVKVYGREVGSSKNRFLGTLYVQNPDINVRYMEFTQEIPHRKTLYGGKTVDVCFVVVDGPVPFLDERGSHKLYETANWDHSETRIVQ